MYFQIIDQRFKCPSVFFNGRIIKKPDYAQMSRTWSYHPSFSEKSVELGQILANGKTLDEACPETLKESWQDIKKQHNAFEKSFREAKINPKEHCFYDLVPERFLIEYFGIKNKITQHVFENFAKPKNYDFLYELSQLSDEISRHYINLNLKHLDKTAKQVRTINLKKKLKQIDSRIKYNIFGTITGRLATKKNSFPILTLDKKYRALLKPNNDVFVELDFNAAELRTFLALNNIQQPLNDLHDWHVELHKKQFNEDVTRDEMKTKIFAWLYSGKDLSFGIKEIDDAYNRKSILDKYWDGNFVQTPFDRKIASEERKAISMVVQSTTADIFFRQVLKVRKYLIDKSLKTYIAMLIHDSMILDVSKNEIKTVLEIIKIFSDTIFGKFKTRVKVGANLGEMREATLKVYV